MLKKALLLLFVFFLNSPGAALGTSLAVDFEEALKKIDAYDHNGAKRILACLIEELAERGTHNNPFGLNVQLRYAEVQEKSNQDEIAMQNLLQILEASAEKGLWGINAHANIILARLHEKHLRWERCAIYLAKAAKIIDKYDIDSIRARLCLRKCSYFRQNEIYLDSALNYAEKAIEFASWYNQYEYKATGHLLKGNLIWQDSSQKALENFRKAAEGYNSIGNFSHLSYSLNGISRVFFYQKKYDLALLYNDSCVISQRLAINQGHDAFYWFPSLYRFRSSIFSTMGRLDSALFYEKLSNEYEIERITKLNAQNVLEIEAKYNDERKTLQLEEKEQQLAYERSNRNSLIVVITLILFGVALLCYLYFRLRTANKKTEQQAQTIQQTNAELAKSLEQQIMLQGEIHHRVKNNLQVIISLLDLQQDEIEDPKALESLHSMSNRIYSMAAIHDLLYRKKGTDQISLKEYAQTLCQHFRQMVDYNQQVSCNLNIPDVVFNLETLMPIGIVLNELMTNSIKYAIQPGQLLAIDLSLEPHADGYCLSYSDNGPGFPKKQLEERQGGLGSYLLKSMARQLRGRLTSYNEGGAVVQFYFDEKNKHIKNESLSNTYH